MCYIFIFLFMYCQVINSMIFLSLFRYPYWDFTILSYLSPSLPN